MRKIRVVAFAREAGGASALSPVIHRLKLRHEILVFAKDYAEEVFRRNGVLCSRASPFFRSFLEKNLLWEKGSKGVDVLLTSAASLPHLDMTEKRLWVWARRRGIPSVAVLDQWQNYTARFSGVRRTDRLAFFPDRVAIMDETARAAMISEGIPTEKLVVTGQPAFDSLAQMKAVFTSVQIKQARQVLGVNPKSALLCFVSESFSRDFGSRLGFNEQRVLRELWLLCGKISRRTKRPIHLAIKLHPQNNPRRFEWARESPLPGMSVSLHGGEESPLPLVQVSDVVVGMSSVLLLESILLGRPTVSFQPGARSDSNLTATERGAIPLLTHSQDAERLLTGLLENKTFLTQYLKKQTLFKHDGRAAFRVANLVSQEANRQTKYHQGGICG